MNGEEKIKNYFIDEEMMIENITAEEAYDKIAAWIEAKKMKVVVQNRPYAIKADQGSWIWAGDESEKAKKTFEFILTQSEGKVILRTTINGLVNAYSNVDETRRKWVEIVEALWIELGVKEKPKGVQSLYDSSKLVKEIEKGYRNMLLGISGGFFLFAVGIFVSLLGYSTSYMTGIGVIPFMYGIYGYVSAQNTKKRLLGQQPQGEAPVAIPTATSNRSVLLVSLLITVVSFAAVGYQIMYPPKLTYSGYGVSFNYPISMTVTEGSLADIIISEDVGVLTLTSRDGESEVAVLWVKDPTTTNPDDFLGSIVTESANQYTVSKVEYRSMPLPSGGSASAVYYGLTSSDVEIDAACIAWYDSGKEKLYVLTFASDGHLTSLINTIYNSFETS